MFWNIWNLILWREAINKWSSCSDDSKHGASILGKSEQKFKIQSYFGIIYPIIGEAQWYDDTSSQDIDCVYEIYIDISFLYWIKEILDIW